MIYNRPIYHCQCCGAVVVQEQDRLPPLCCGREMVKAGEETLRDSFAREMDVDLGLTEPRMAPRWSAPETESVSG